MRRHANEDLAPPSTLGSACANRSHSALNWIGRCTSTLGPACANRSHHLCSRRLQNPSRPPLSREVRDATPPVLRPLVATHPETGEDAVYVPGCHIARVLDLTTGEEVPYETVIPPLVEHVTRHVPGGTYAHQWRRGDVVVWDNRCTLHAPSHFDNENEIRLMWRLTMFGEEILPAPEELHARLEEVGAASWQDWDRVEVSIPDARSAGSS